MTTDQQVQRSGQDVDRDSANREARGYDTRGRERGVSTEEVDHLIGTVRELRAARLRALGDARRLRYGS